jgi:hypothetical protein
MKQPGTLIENQGKKLKTSGKTSHYKRITCLKTHYDLKPGITSGVYYTYLNYKSHEDVQIYKMDVSWDVAPCSLVEAYRRFRGAFCLHYQGDEAVSTSETSVNFYQTTRCNIPEDRHLHTRCRENLKSHHVQI